MIININGSTIAFIAVGIAACALALYIWKRRNMPGGVYFSILMAALSAWAFMNVISYISGPGFVYDTLDVLAYMAVTSAGPLWLLFVLDYGYRSRWPITRKTQAFWLLPGIIMVFALTNGWHGLIWPRGPGDVSVLGFGVGLWINLIYTYLLLGTGFCLLILTTIRGTKKSYLKTITLVAGTAIPIVTSLFYMTGMIPDIVNQLTPMGLLVTTVLYAWSIFGLRLFDLVPAARAQLVRSMSDGVLVIDREGLIADMNPAVSRMLGVPENTTGQPVETTLSQWPELARHCLNDTVATHEIKIDGRDGPAWVDVRISSLYDNYGRLNGRLATLWDITERKRAEERLLDSNRRLQSEVAERVHAEALLTKEIVERKRAESELAVSLREKELLLKEIHHRVKNNLQIVSSLLSLQTDSVSDTGVSVSLKESQNRIKSMALIHEQLYQSSDLSKVDFKSYVENLVLSLSQSYVTRPDVKIETHIDNVSLTVDHGIPCGLIINELISNCLKHAFKDGRAGLIKISMSGNGNEYTLTISDNGMGLAEGMDFRNTESLGMQLVVTLVEQLNGTIEHLNSEGTTFVIKFRV